MATFTTDWANQQIIETTGATVTITIQELVDYIRAQEASETGILYDQIATATGKVSLGGSVAVAITLELESPWQLKLTAGGDYIATVTAGNLVGGLGGDPIAYTAGVQTLLLQSAASTIVNVGTGLTAGQEAELTRAAKALTTGQFIALK